MARVVTGADYGIRTDSGSRRQFDRQFFSPRNLMYALYPYMRRQTVYLDEDFLEDTINLDKWALSKDANATNFAINAAQGGTIRGTAGNTDGEGISIAGFNVWSGDKNCGMEVRMKLNVVTNAQFEIGFADTATDFKDPIVSDVDVPTVGNGAGDFALIGMDTGETLATGFYASKGSTPYAAQAATLGGWSPTAATYFIARIQLIGDTAYYAVFDDNDVLQAEKTIASSIEGGTAVRPFVNVTRVSTADKIADIDYIRVWQDR